MDAVAGSARKWSSHHPSAMYSINFSSCRSLSATLQKSAPATLYCRCGKLNAHTNDIARRRTRAPFFADDIIIKLATDYTKNSILNDKKQITGKNSIMSACNLRYRLKRSGPKIYLEVLTKKSPILSSTYLRPWSSKPKIIIRFFLDISSQNKLLVIYNLKNQHFTLLLFEKLFEE